MLPDALGVRLNIGGYACNLDAQLCAFPMPDMAGSHITGSPLYIFLDEVQNVTDFPKVLDSLYIKKNIDIYVTGSSSIVKIIFG